ncbi:MAG: FkbM family methyltransferase [Kiritimatiellae bacterium]|nr:FkbM family methyltransferase [Kiritimatiellia bacterium]
MNLLARMMDFVRRHNGYGFPRVGPAYHFFKRLLPERITTVLFPGVVIELNLKDETHLSTYWRGPRFEQPTPSVLAQWGRAGASVFFDIGANYGFFSYWMLWQCPHISVCAFDPHPANHAIILQTRERNGLSRLRAVPLALGDKKETAVLRYGTTDCGHSTLAPHPALGSTGCSIVDVVTFDDWCAREHLVARAGQWIAKIDVEGYELKVLRGMQKALSQKAFSGLVVEINPYTLSLMNTRPTDIFDLLRGFGYRPMRVRVRPRDTMNTFFVPDD